LLTVLPSEVGFTKTNPNQVGNMHTFAWFAVIECVDELIDFAMVGS